MGLLLAAGAAILLLVVILLATRGGAGSGDVAGGRSNGGGASAGAVALPVPIHFGTSVDPSTGTVASPRARFLPGDSFAYSVTLPGPVGTDTVEVEVIHRAADGSQQVMQPPSSQPVDRARSVFAFEVSADALIQGFGTGDFQMRIYRARQLIAQGTFILADA